MSEVNETPVVLCQDTLVRLAEDFTLPDGKIMPRGTLALLIPQTVADCILTPDGESLAQAWSTLSRSGHTHPEIAAFSEELVRISERMATVEIGFANIESAKAAANSD